MQSPNDYTSAHWAFSYLFCYSRLAFLAMKSASSEFSGSLFFRPEEDFECPFKKSILFLSLSLSVDQGFAFIVSHLNKTHKQKIIIPL